MVYIAKKYIQNISRGAVNITLLSMLMLLAQNSALAFKPTADNGHAGLTRNALGTISYTTSDGNNIGFTAAAIIEVEQANAGVDGGGGFLLSVPHCDGEELIACSGRLITLRKNTVSAVSNSSTRDGDVARRFLGQALHTLQDFYSHSNWVNNPGPNNTSVNADLGENLIPQLRITDATCVNDILNDNILTELGLTRITTGYFGSTPDDKCTHGILASAGIHKDQPGRPFYTEAFATASQSTTNFINLIVADLAGNDDAVRALFGLGSTVGFIIDDTGSMGEEISGIKVALGNIITSTSSTSSTTEPASSYMLVTFGDPTVSSAFVSSDPAAILSAVNAISVGGGGDCPEFSQSGLLRAISASQTNGKLYLFTDASAKDAALASSVSAAAAAKKITINYALTGSCSPIDPAYLRVARNTGGQAFIIGANETAKLFGLIEPTLTGDIESILIVSGNLDGSGKQYEVPVDSDISSLTFSIIANGGYTLLTPSGLPVDSSNPNVDITVLSSGSIITVASPASGVWSLDLPGSGDFSVSVLGSTSLAVEQFAFLEQGGREAHTGLFPIQGLPLVSNEVLAMLELVGDYSSVNFQLRTLAGDLLKDIPLLQGAEEDLPSTVFSGRFTIPSEAFRVYVSGQDNMGEQFIRAFPQAIKAQLVDVQLSLDEALSLQVGKSTSFKVVVTNLGAAANYRIDAVDELNYISGVSDSLISLASNESKEITISVTVPEGSPEGQYIIIVSATNTANPEINNTARLALNVFDITDSDGDGLIDEEDTCPNSNLAPTVVIGSCDSGSDNILAEVGCTISDLVDAAAGSKNHGSFVSTVTNIASDAKSLNLISGRDYGKIISCAAKSGVE